MNLETLKLKEIAYAHWFEFTKDKKNVVVTEVDSIKFDHGFPEPVTKERTMSIDNLD